MTKRTLIFITAEYPYGKGETFIENEIAFLCSEFDKVIIVSQVKNSKTVARKIPPNCSVNFVRLTSRRLVWFSVATLLFSNKHIFIEFFSQLIVNPFRNKILLASLRNAVRIKCSLSDIIENEHYDHICLYSYWLDDSAIAVALLNYQKRIVKISRVHGWDLFFERHPHQYLPLRKFLVKSLDMLFSISETGRQYLYNRLMVSSKIDVSRLGTLNSSVADCTATNNNYVTVLSISNVIELKRLHLIGDAMKLLPENIFEWKHFGSGPLLDKYSIDYGNKIFAGQFSNNTLKEELKLLADHSVLINVSSFEGIPVSMMEAMSFGIPCIGTNVGGVSEIIKDNYNGYLLPAHPSPQIVAQCILKYFQLPAEEKTAMRLNARKTWEEKYDAQKNYTDFIEKIKKLSIE